jgi:hypothetical protein
LFYCSGSFHEGPIREIGEVKEREKCNLSSFRFPYFKETKNTRPLPPETFFTLLISLLALTSFFFNFLVASGGVSNSQFAMTVRLYYSASSSSRMRRET